ncbi:MAG: SMC-Scp complex subunit ScpB [Phycisphaerae bacterium]|nr:SMC-Scp complex subunit ScpB [Phycisphaerae bacterium]
MNETAEPPATEAPPEPPREPEVTNASIVEAVLFSADGPLPPARIAQVLGTGTAGDVRRHVESLNESYRQHGAAFRIDEVAGGYQMLTLPVYHRWLSKLSANRGEARLSQAALETLAVVAYKQPVIRADIESIRGVAVGDVLNRLRELNLVKVVGRAEVIGRPMLYGTTKKFLEVFGLASLDALPSVEALIPPERQRPAPASEAAPQENAEAPPENEPDDTPAAESVIPDAPDAP